MIITIAITALLLLVGAVLFFKPFKTKLYRGYRWDELPPITPFTPFKMVVHTLILFFSTHPRNTAILRERLFYCFEKTVETGLYFWQRHIPFIRRFVVHLERGVFPNFCQPVLQPYAYDAKHDYPSMDLFTSRGPWHLMLKDAPDAEKRFYPEASIKELVADLFSRPSGEFVPGRNSLWYPCLATFHHYSVFSADDNDFAASKNIVLHAHLQSVYGITKETTDALREMKGGLLKSSRLPSSDEEFLPFASDCPGVEQKKYRAGGSVLISEEERATFYCCGNDRVNASPMFMVPAALYLRMHNKIARDLSELHPTYDDERLFQVTRNVMITCHLKHLIHEIRFQFADAFSFGNLGDLSSLPANNGTGLFGAVTLESKLAYIFHEAIPDGFEIGMDIGADDAKPKPWQQFYFQPKNITRYSLEQWQDCLTRQRCGRLCLMNTPKEFLPVTSRHLELCRQVRMPPFNAYRKRLDLPPYKTFEEMCANDKVCAKLKHHYKHVDNVEFYVGIYAEDPYPLAFGLADFCGVMYATILKSTLSQLTFFSPYLHCNILNAGEISQQAFSQYGLSLIDVYDNNRWFESVMKVQLKGRNCFFSDWYRKQYLVKSLCLERDEKGSPKALK